MTTSATRHHPKSVRLSFGYLQIGPKPKTLKSLSGREVSKAFKETLRIQANRRIVKLRTKIAQGKLSETDAIIGLLECALGVRAPRTVGAKP